MDIVNNLFMFDEPQKIAHYCNLNMGDKLLAFRRHCYYLEPVLFVRKSKLIDYPVEKEMDILY